MRIRYTLYIFSRVDIDHRELPFCCGKHKLRDDKWVYITRINNPTKIRRLPPARQPTLKSRLSFGSYPQVTASTVNNNYCIIIYMKERTCTICKKQFSSYIPSKNNCSFECKREHNRRNSLIISREKRAGTYVKKGRQYIKNTRIIPPCEICGFNETIDRHREGNKLVILCPNHHCLITRGKITLAELFRKNNLPIPKDTTN